MDDFQLIMTFIGSVVLLLLILGYLFRRHDPKEYEVTIDKRI